VAFGKLGEVVGLETEIAYYPEVFDNAAAALAKSHVLTVSGNMLIGPTIGRIKAYGAAGAGALNLNVTSLSSLVGTDLDGGLSSNYFAINVGGGVAGFFAAHFGVRGDLRYYRAFGFDLTDFEASGLALEHFNFWRGNIGLVARF
jgi:hypothetical protein